MKYLLDTDVVSKYTENPPNSRVDAWIQRTDDRDLYISVVTIAELWYGINKLPPGKRRAELEDWIQDGLYMQFFNRYVGFDMTAARYYGSLMARAKKNGHNPAAIDVLIAATAVANGMTIATLNRRDFGKLGVDLVEF